MAGSTKAPAIGGDHGPISGGAISPTPQGQIANTTPAPAGLPLPAIIGGGVGGVLLISLVILGVYIWYRRKYPVRMVLGKDFQRFSNPAYNTKRMSTLKLIVEDPLAAYDEPMERINEGLVLDEENSELQPIYRQETPDDTSVDNDESNEQSTTSSNRDETEPQRRKLKQALLVESEESESFMVINESNTETFENDMSLKDGFEVETNIEPVTKDSEGTDGDNSDTKTENKSMVKDLENTDGDSSETETENMSKTKDFADTDEDSSEPKTENMSTTKDLEGTDVESSETKTEHTTTKDVEDTDGYSSEIETENKPTVKDTEHTDGDSSEGETENMPKPKTIEYTDDDASKPKTENMSTTKELEDTDGDNSEIETENEPVDKDLENLNRDLDTPEDLEDTDSESSESETENEPLTKDLENANGDIFETDTESKFVSKDFEGTHRTSSEVKAINKTKDVIDSDNKGLLTETRHVPSGYDVQDTATDNEASLIDSGKGVEFEIHSEATDRDRFIGDPDNEFVTNVSEETDSQRTLTETHHEPSGYNVPADNLEYEANLHENRAYIDQVNAFQNTNETDHNSPEDITDNTSISGNQVLKDTCSPTPNTFDETNTKSSPFKVLETAEGGVAAILDRQYDKLATDNDSHNIDKVDNDKTPMTSGFNANVNSSKHETEIKEDKRGNEAQAFDINVHLHMPEVNSVLTGERESLRATIGDTSMNLESPIDNTLTTLDVKEEHVCDSLNLDLDTETIAKDTSVDNNPIHANFSTDTYHGVAKERGCETMVEGNEKLAEQKLYFSDLTPFTKDKQSENEGKDAGSKILDFKRGHRLSTENIVLECPPPTPTVIYDSIILEPDISNVDSKHSSLPDVRDERSFTFDLVNTTSKYPNRPRTRGSFDNYQSLTATLSDSFQSLITNKRKDHQPELSCPSENNDVRNYNTGTFTALEVEPSMGKELSVSDSNLFASSSENSNFNEKNSPFSENVQPLSNEHKKEEDEPKSNDIGCASTGNFASVISSNQNPDLSSTLMDDEKGEESPALLDTFETLQEVDETDTDVPSVKSENPGSDKESNSSSEPELLSDFTDSTESSESKSWDLVEDATLDIMKPIGAHGNNIMGKSDTKLLKIDALDFDFNDDSDTSKDSDDENEESVEITTEDESNA